MDSAARLTCVRKVSAIYYVLNFGKLNLLGPQFPCL